MQQESKQATKDADTQAMLDKTQFVEFCVSLKTDLQSFLLQKLSCKQDADDVLQELFYAVNKMNESLIVRIEDQRGYIFRVANNLAIKVIKKRINSLEVNVDDAAIHSIPSSKQSPEFILDEQQRASLVMASLSTMPSIRRQVFLLYRFGNMTKEELAVELNMSVDAVEKNITRAMNHCKAYIERRYK